MRSRLSAIRLVLVSAVLAGPLAAGRAVAGEGKGAKEGGKEGGKEQAAPALLQPTNEYVHAWKTLPSGIVLHNVAGDDETEVKAHPGRMTLVIFLASWCEPCQQLMPDLQRLEKRYHRLNTDIYYVFAHDTREDAAGFMKQYGMESGYLANSEALAAYHDPELPSIVVADRHGWLTGRYPHVTAPQLAELSDFLKILTAY